MVNDDTQTTYHATCREVRKASDNGLFARNCARRELRIRTRGHRKPVLQSRKQAPFMRRADMRRALVRCDVARSCPRLTAEIEAEIDMKRSDHRQIEDSAALRAALDIPQNVGHTRARRCGNHEPQVVAVLPFVIVIHLGIRADHVRDGIDSRVRN